MDNKILEKIKKCLRLAKSANANEAATALRQAQALMDKHGMSREDVAASDVESQQTTAGAGRTPPKHLVMLMGMVSHAFGVEPIYSVCHDGKRWNGRVEFIGLGSAPEVACYAYEVLGRQLKRGRTEYLKSLSKRIKRATKMRRGDLYAEGWIHAVSQQVIPHVLTESECQAMEAYKARRWSKPLDKVQARSRKAHTKDLDALIQGVSDGKKVQFYQGVNGQRQAALSQEV
jgi:hypothetical protein